MFLFRFSILSGIGNYLIREDKLEYAEIMFVLGGGSLERGNEAGKLYKLGYTNKIYCTSENIPSLLEAIGKPMTEAEVTKMHIENLGVPPNKVNAISKASSTKEEAEYIRQFCDRNKIKTVMVLTTKFHTHRVQNVFSKAFIGSKTKLIIRGAPSTKFKEDKWWEKEEGMLFVNNEYMKMIYYWWKY